MSYKQVTLNVEDKQMKAAIEGLLFVSGDEGIEVNQLAKILEADRSSILDCLEEMVQEFKQQDRGIQIVEVAGHYLLTTLPRHASIFEKLAQTPAHSTLSQASLETLAIIAYRQPITRAEIEQIRGVKTDRPIQTLMNKSLIKETGRKEGLGRPILFGTTREFLEYFGLSSLEDLPPMSEEMNIEDVQEEADFLFSGLKNST